MGLFSGVSEKMKAKAEETKAKEIERRKEYFQQFLLEGEVIESLYPVGADSLAMTEWRLLFVEEFNTDKSRVLITLPYSQIVEVKMVLGDMYSFSNKVYVATKSETHEFSFPKFIKEEEVKEFYIKLMQKIRQMAIINRLAKDRCITGLLHVQQTIRAREFLFINSGLTPILKEILLTTMFNIILSMG